MKNIIFILVALVLTLNASEYTQVKYTLKETENLIKEFHQRLNDCKIDDRTKELSKEIERAFYPLDDFDFSNHYDPEIISELRRLNLQNQQFLTNFVMTSDCKIDSLN
ncbi:MAG: hypothetical protein MR902_05795 [Campylobacter sp.]|nr:hypothetical protein [Campylobacter sp.]